MGFLQLNSCGLNQQTVSNRLIRTPFFYLNTQLF